MSRHTPIKGSLTRSFGVEDDQDLVVAMRDDGYVSVRYEPTHRKLKRGEILPQFSISVEDLWAMRDKPVANSSEVGGILERIAAKLPVAQLIEDGEKNLGYAVKVWLMNALKDEIQKHA